MEQPPNRSPKPHCPECGVVIHPAMKVAIISNEQVIDETVPEGMEYPKKHSDIFAGVYCSSDCVIDATTRGWPEFRSSLKED